MSTSVGQEGGFSGTFGNPVKVGAQCQECGIVHQKGGETLLCFEKYLLRRVDEDSEFRAQALSLRGKVLGCFCKPAACHGDVLVRWLEGAVRR